MQLYAVRFTNVYNPEEEIVTDACYTEEQALILIEMYSHTWSVEYFIQG